MLVSFAREATVDLRDVLAYLMLADAHEEPYLCVPNDHDVQLLLRGSLVLGVVE